MNNNIINSNIDTITFLTPLQYNIFQVGLSGINFSLASHIYANYLCTIFLGSDGNEYLEYFDGTNMLYVLPNS
jgi:hypothetical protein